MLGKPALCASLVIHENVELRDISFKCTCIFKTLFCIFFSDEQSFMFICNRNGSSLSYPNLALEVPQDPRALTQHPIHFFV